MMQQKNQHITNPQNYKIHHQKRLKTFPKTPPIPVMAPPLTWRPVHSLRVEAAKRRSRSCGAASGEELRLPEKVWGGTVEDLEEWCLGSWKHETYWIFIIHHPYCYNYMIAGNILERLSS